MSAASSRVGYLNRLEKFHTEKPPTKVDAPVLPEGCKWAPHVTPAGPNPERTRRPGPGMELLAELMSL